MGGSADVVVGVAIEWLGSPHARRSGLRSAYRRSIRPEADLRQFLGHGTSIQRSVEIGLGYCGWIVPDGLEVTGVVEPVDSFRRGILDGLETAARATAMDDFGFGRPLIVGGQVLGGRFGGPTQCPSLGATHGPHVFGHGERNLPAPRC